MEREREHHWAKLRAKRDKELVDLPNGLRASPETVRLNKELSSYLQRYVAERPEYLKANKKLAKALAKKEATEEPNASRLISSGVQAQNMPIYPKNAIVSAPEDDSQRIFLRGPFDDFEEAAFCDPYVLNLDYSEGMGRNYISINSWKGRIPVGTNKECLLGNEILELASQGGWDWDNDYAYHEVYSGGADVIPHYVTKRIAAGLHNFLRNAAEDIEFEVERLAETRCFGPQRYLKRALPQFLGKLF